MITQETIILEDSNAVNPNQENPDLETSNSAVVFYSANAIQLATFLGGPLIGGYLMRDNYRTLGEKQQGKQALWWGIAATILVFGGLLALPSTVSERIPNYILPAIFAGVIRWIVEVKQGAVLRQHKEQNLAFYSNWRAAGLALLSACMIALTVFFTVFLWSNDPAYEAYQTQLETFTQNEQETLVFYDDLYTKTREELLRELNLFVLPKWEENVALAQQAGQVENFPAELQEHQKNLLKYSELRMKAFKLFRRAIEEDTEQYSEEIEKIHLEIGEVLEQLK
ncbi:hypothetical protein [Myroides sp. DW712]|uniref:hypothetical protein n=1 Tax=Myroides sp. DW712 TaxID=3389800 RepID=UPI003979ECCA